MATPEAQRLRIEVAHGGEREVVVLPLEVDKGTTVRQAIEQSGILGRFSGLEPEQNGVGIFARRVTPDTLVSHGDRIEIYRPIKADAKEVRRRRASRQRRDQG